MPKLAVIAIFVSLAFVSQGFPSENGDIASAAAAGNWDEVHRILQRYYDNKFGLMDYDVFPLRIGGGAGDLKSLRPEGGGKVYGESEFSFHTASSDAKGKIHQESGGHKIINDNGRVTEYDFKPPVPPVDY